MWKTDELGLATWQDDHCRWNLDARGGKAGVGVVDAEEVSAGSLESASRLVCLSPVDQAELPVATEHYVRGDSYHVVYPQAGGIYELRIAYRMIESDRLTAVLETTIAIQTDRLDSHPQLDIDVPCESIDSIIPSELSSDFDAPTAPISLGISSGHSVAVLLGPHDHPFTTNHCTDSLLRLRLFGDFLEKGVIRKARPWLVIHRDQDLPSPTQLQQWWKRLCESPLPLTA